MLLPVPRQRNCPARGPDPAGASLGKPSCVWASSAQSALGFVLTRDAPGGSKQKCTPGQCSFLPICAAFGPSVQACPVLGSRPWLLPCPGGNVLSPSPGMCLRRRKGWGAALSRSCFRLGLAMGTAPAMAAPQARGCDRGSEQGMEGQKCPRYQVLLQSLLCLSFPGKQRGYAHHQGSPRLCKRAFGPRFWGTQVPTPHSQDTWVTQTHPPAAWIPATLAWDLRHFGGTDGLDKPRSPSVGTLGYHRGSVLTGGCGRAASPPSPRAPKAPELATAPKLLCPGARSDRGFGSCS